MKMLMHEILTLKLPQTLNIPTVRPFSNCFKSN